MRSGSTRSRIAGLAVTLAVTTAAFVLLRRCLPDAATVVRSLLDARRWWLATALLLQTGSILMYAEQQRRLLTAYGGTMSTGRAVGVSLARMALSTAMPAGGPVSTAFAVRQFRTYGLTSASALATTVLAGLQASVATALVYLAWCLTAGPTTIGLLSLAAAAALGCAAAVALTRRRARPRTGPGATRGVRYLVALTADTTRACWSLPGASWLTTGGAAVARRLCDLACFVAVAQAYRLDTAPAALVGAYLTGQLVRQIPLVAGGAGLVEASLLAALVASGAQDTAAAAAAVLTFRLLSCWLVALAGLPVVIGLGATRPPGPREHRRDPVGLSGAQPDLHPA